MMPHIYIHKSKEEPQQHQLAAPMKQNNNANKYANIGRPYRVKTKLPFHDSRGVYNPVRVGAAAANSSSLVKKSRSTGGQSQTTNQFMRKANSRENHDDDNHHLQTMEA